MSEYDFDFFINKVVKFKIPDGTSIELERPANYLSETIRGFLKVASGEVFEFPIEQPGTERSEVDLLNSCIKFFQDKIPKELKEKADDREYWVENTCQHKEGILALTKDLHPDILIRGANLADYLLIHPFMHFCAYALADRAQDKTLEEVRQMLHITDDQFNDEERQIIKDCPELFNV